MTGSVGSKVFDKTNCTATVISPTGKLVDLAGKKSANLPDGSKPPIGNYQYAYILIGNDFNLAGELTVNQSGTYQRYYSKRIIDNGEEIGYPTPDATKAAETHSETLNNMGFG